LASRLQALNPVAMQIEGTAVEMTVHGDEASLIRKLADISRVTPILQFEVRGPTLEEIFMTLVKESA
jgi:hypothetical protein